MARYDQRRYWASHNSYSGETRGTILDQLGAKVRCLELDFWDNDYASLGDYRVGHLRPGHEVATGNGNPDTPFLKEWLKVVAGWSKAHPGHAPITLVLDGKSDLTDNDVAGDLEDLNQTLEKIFGTRLFTRDDYDSDPTGAWPDTAALRDKVICVLSGNSNTRFSYRYCNGTRPALAVNPDGAVVLAYRSTVGDMRYWSGQVKLGGKRIEWLRKGTYAFNNPNTVSEPALTMTDDGFVISVHRVGPRPGEKWPAILEYRVGELQDDGRIAWSGPGAVAKGIEPSVAMISTNKLQEVHKTWGGQGLRLCDGTLNRSKKTIEWTDPVETEDPPFPRDTADFKGHLLQCSANGQDRILAAVDGVARDVGYRQIAFVELQNDERREELVDPLFYGASAGETAKIARARHAGFTARGWWFKKEHRVEPPSPPQENHAGTDFPMEVWYDDYMKKGGQSEA